MKYSALIENRKSVREFKDKKVNTAITAELGAYFYNTGRKLVPGIDTELRMYGSEAREALEGAAGYESFLVGAPQYMVLLSAKHPQAGLNAGYIMQDMILKLTHMGLDSCWVTFTDGDAVKKALDISSELDVAAIVAFGYGEKTTKRLRFNVKSMSDVDITAQRSYFNPKRPLSDMVFMNTWGKTDGVNEYIGFYDNLLWEALYAASLSPSYLNRQPYGFVLENGKVTLVSTPDEYTGTVDKDLNLGIVLLHFTAVAEELSGKVDWSFGGSSLTLPEGYTAVASCTL